MAKSRRIMYIIIIGVFVVALVFSGVINFRKGIYIGDRFFYKSSDSSYNYNTDNRIIVQKNDGSTDFIIIIGGEQQSANLQWAQENVTLTYDDGTVINGIWDKDQLCGEDGFPITYSGIISVHTGGEEERYSVSKDIISDTLCRIDKSQTEFRGSILMVIAGSILYLAGALTFLFPNKSHFFMRGWAYKKQELSDEGILAEKIGAVAIMVLGIVGVLGLFISIR